MTITDDIEEAGIGHNRPPPHDAEALAKLEAEVRLNAQRAAKWLDAGAVSEEWQAGEVNDLLQGVKRTIREIETKRKADKEPHLEAGRQVDAAYRKVTDPLSKLADRLAAILTEYMKAKRAEEERQRQEELRRAEEERRRIEEEARAAAARNDVFGEEQAAARAREIERTVKQVAKARSTGAVESASGGGRTASLRTYHEVEVVNIKTAFVHLVGAYEAEFLHVIERAALKEYRETGQPVPGTKIHDRQKAV